MLGGLALVLVLFRWRWVSTRYREAWAKLAVAGFRAVAAGSAIASRAVPPVPNQPLLDQPWVITTLVAVTGHLLWEATGAVGDHRHKAAKEKTAAGHEQEIEALTQDRDDAELQAFRSDGWSRTCGR